MPDMPSGLPPMGQIPASPGAGHEEKKVESAKDKSIASMAQKILGSSPSQTPAHQQIKGPKNANLPKETSEKEIPRMDEEIHPSPPGGPAGH